MSFVQKTGGVIPDHVIETGMAKIDFMAFDFSNCIALSANISDNWGKESSLLVLLLKQALNKCFPNWWL